MMLRQSFGVALVAFEKEETYDNFPVQIGASFANPREMGNLFAHELGHLMGMEHDNNR